jgi:hypothetical protein
VLKRGQNPAQEGRRRSEAAERSEMSKPRNHREWVVELTCGYYTPELTWKKRAMAKNLRIRQVAPVAAGEARARPRNRAHEGDPGEVLKFLKHK